MCTAPTRILLRIATCGVTFDLVGVICEQLAAAVGCCTTRTSRMNNLDQFIPAGPAQSLVLGPHL